MRLHLALALGKLIFYSTRMLKRGGGSAAPGLHALKIDPNLIEKLIKKIPQNIIITGTNGKTTTSRMLAHFAQSQGLKVIRNSTGSNLERGIASTLITKSRLLTLDSRLSQFDLGIWELDEAAFNGVAPKIKADIVVFLNIYRDQLDRYGEINSVLKRWQETLKKLDPKTIILINGDDHNLQILKKSFKGEVLTFGLDKGKIRGEQAKDTKISTKLDFEARDIKSLGLNGSKFNLPILHTSYPILLNLPGIYHIYDFLGAFATGLKLKLEPKGMVDSLKSFLPAFGRVEKIDLKDQKEGYIFLIKNPTGATQVFETLSSELTDQDSLLIALNDNFADGTDVSWIWDAEFEKLKIVNCKLKIICSGTRAYDLAVRLKYAGFEPKSIEVIPDLKIGLEDAQRGLKGRLFILPTYTALLELQGILAKSQTKKYYWQED